VERTEADPETVTAPNGTVPVPLISIDLLCVFVLSLCFDYRIPLVMYSISVGTQNTLLHEFW